MYDPSKVYTLYRILQPAVLDTGYAVIHCMIQAIDTSAISRYCEPVSSSPEAISHLVNWSELPGNSDTSKLLWILRKLSILNSAFP